MNGLASPIKLAVCLLTVGVLLTGCASQRGGTADLQQLRELSGSSIDLGRSGINGIRYKGLRDAALSIGAQSALAWRSKNINQSLDKYQEQLERVYDFNAILLDHNVLPPVLLEGRTTLNQDGSHTLRLSDRTYKIIDQARFVTAAPHWREYLWMNFKQPDRPNTTILPKTHHEKDIWDEYVTKGWEQGIEQANHIFTDNLARLTADYKGMVLYRTLLAQNMVTAPFVAKSNLGVTGNAHEMRVNDQVLRITALPGLRVDSKNWKPAISQQ